MAAGSSVRRRVILDAPCAHPRLGFDTYATALKRLIQESRPQFAIGIFGSWGSGKTTLMDSVRTQLETAPDVICVEFSAWRYEKEEHLIVPLLDSMRESILEWSARQPADVRKLGRSTAATIGRVTRALVAGFSLKVGLPHALEVSFDANRALTAARGGEDRDAAIPRSFYHAAFRALRSSIEAFRKGADGRRVVVFIDDLDRCLPAGALEVLESMKLFFDVPGFVFVVGLDRAVVEWCIDSRYQREGSPGSAGQAAPIISGAEYINKIFQVPFTLPPVATRDLSDFLESVITDNGLAGAEADELRSIVRAHLDDLVRDVPINPRRIKQYINAYVLQMGVKPHLKSEAVLAIQTINFRDDWASVRNALVVERTMLLDALSKPTMPEQRQALRDLDPTYVEIPDAFLAYMAGPGHQLLQERAHIDEYLYAGEASRSIAYPALLEFLPRVSRLRSLLRDAVADDGQVQEERLSSLLEAVAVCSSQTPSVLPGPVGQMVQMILEEVKDDLTRFQSMGPIRPNADDNLAWRARQDERLHQAKRSLRAAYETGALTTPTGSVPPPSEAMAASLSAS